MCVWLDVITRCVGNGIDIRTLLNDLVSCSVMTIRL